MPKRLIDPFEVWTLTKKELYSTLIMIDLFLEPFFPGVLCQGVDGKTCLLRLFLPSILTRNNDRLGIVVAIKNEVRHAQKLFKASLLMSQTNAQWQRG